MNLEELKQTFDMLEDGEEKYAYVIELGKQLPPYPSNKKNDEHRIYGCSSNVWFDFKNENGKYYFDFDSNALIVKGLLFIIKLIFDGKTPDEMGKINAMDFFEKIGLKSSLSNQRQVGLSSIITKIEGLK